VRVCSWLNKHSTDEQLASSDSLFEKALWLSQHAERDGMRTLVVFENPVNSRFWERKVVLEAAEAFELVRHDVSYCRYGFTIEKRTGLLMSALLAERFPALKCLGATCPAKRPSWGDNCTEFVHAKTLVDVPPTDPASGRPQERSKVPPLLGFQVVCAAVRVFNSGSPEHVERLKLRGRERVGSKVNAYSECCT